MFEMDKKLESKINNLISLKINKEPIYLFPKEFIDLLNYRVENCHLNVRRGNGKFPENEYYCHEAVYKGIIFTTRTITEISEL